MPPPRRVDLLPTILASSTPKTTKTLKEMCKSNYFYYDTSSSWLSKKDEDMKIKVGGLEKFVESRDSTKTELYIPNAKQDKKLIHRCRGRNDERSKKNNENGPHWQFRRLPFSKTTGKGLPQNKHSGKSVKYSLISQDNSIYKAE